ncbi:MAG: hypothetical protein H8D78_04080 [Chloroflexi bacterium]|nr:hypothetical protein [Chloroflexota bacterium]
MMKQNASLDASFWFNAYEAQVVGFLPNYYNLFVCRAVADEILYAKRVLGVPSPACELFRDWQKQGIVTLSEPRQPVDWFDSGENYAIALAMEQGYRLLIDDGAPYHYAKSKGITVHGTAEFIVFLYRRDLLTYKDALARIAGLEINKRMQRVAMRALALLAQAKGDRK